MNLHEYQAKQVFAQFSMPVPNNEVVESVDQVPAALKKLSGNRWVVKAQVHAGGRGKAGGVKLLDSADAVTQTVSEMLGTNLVTYQTNEAGQPINQVLIEEISNISRELYLGAVIDRASQRVVIMASTEGGMEIEKVAAETPEKILKATLNPLTGLQAYQARELAFGLGLEGDQIKQFIRLLDGFAKMFVEKDLSLVEINPLVVTEEGQLICLDGKINIDDNALYRQKEIYTMRDESQEDERENRAKEWDLNYISLDGDIGCMVNGAGLAMATMDLIKLCGGEPANFLDVGGGATKERVSEAFKIILSDSNVKGILVNIFGGIVRCDLIAEGIIGAVEEVHVNVPVVVRLEGNNAERGSQLLSESGVNIIAANDLTDAAKKIVAEVKK
ncbi:Succinyl-CoA ligase [ADP-forming] beta chain [hydrothermal vent metagenome]|uniref:Succinyl-CoA ligase [ADP-forming] beta chain n=1 Tax=hydrothermal vent metagenome TaxID=652676 RepID=A0A3B0XH71_9ZZZZ